MRSNRRQDNIVLYLHIIIWGEHSITETSYCSWGARKMEDELRNIDRMGIKLYIVANPTYRVELKGV